MTPKEKAKDLIEMFIPNVANDGYNKREKVENKNAIRCAIICADEILSLRMAHAMGRDDKYSEKEFWNEVKKEINKIP